MLDYSKLPEHMRNSVARYIEDGIMPGSFLTAILENDFITAAAHADDVNKNLLYEWALWLMNEVPRFCYGDKKKVREWCAKGGLKGRFTEKEIEKIKKL